VQTSSVEGAGAGEKTGFPLLAGNGDVRIANQKGKSIDLVKLMTHDSYIVITIMHQVSGN
jgi:hypothetical protein